MKESIKSIIYEFHTRDIPPFYERDLKLPLDSNKIITVVGPRRAGKTYLLYQHIKALHKSGINKERILYLNFEDERIDLNFRNLDLIIQGYRELYPDIDFKSCYFFFDEVQNAQGWERFIRRIYDTISKNIFLTGSNSKLLSEEIATSLRGRTIKYELFPLSWDEFLRFKNFEFNKKKDFYDSQKRAKLLRHFEEYLNYGGFPEILFLQPVIKIKTLQEYFEVMLYRDIAERYRIKDTLVLKYFLKRIAENTGKFLSVHKIYNELKSQNMKIGKDILYRYLEYAETVYFLKRLKKHYRSQIKSELGEKKIYLIDTGLLKSIRPFGNKSSGAILENAIFKEFLLRGNEIVCFKEKGECDFVINNEMAVQVCHDVTNEDTLKREIAGLKEACRYFKLKEGYIITYNDERYIDVEKDLKINLVPAFKFVMQNFR